MSEFRFLSSNTRGLNIQKLKIINNLFRTKKLDCFFIQELKHSKENITSFFSVLNRLNPNLRLIPNAFVNAGTAVIFNTESLHSVSVLPFNTASFNSQIIRINDTLSLCNIYIPPSYPKKLENLELLKQKKLDAILGDINTHNPLWSSYTPPKHNEYSEFFYNLASNDYINGLDP